MSRLNRLGWSMVPGWVTTMCMEPHEPRLTVEHAAVAGCLISYSFWKKSPITPNYQQVVRSMWGDSYTFHGECVGIIDNIISDLCRVHILFRTTDGKIMPGLAARHFERESAPREFWEPLSVSKAVDDLISSTTNNQGEQ